MVAPRQSRETPYHIGSRPEQTRPELLPSVQRDVHFAAQMRSLSLTETRSRLLQLADQLERDPGLVVGVTKRGRRFMTLLAADR